MERIVPSLVTLGPAEPRASARAGMLPQMVPIYVHYRLVEPFFWAWMKDH